MNHRSKACLAVIMFVLAACNKEKIDAPPMVKHEQKDAAGLWIQDSGDINELTGPREVVIHKVGDRWSVDTEGFDLWKAKGPSYNASGNVLKGKNSWGSEYTFVYEPASDSLRQENKDGSTYTFRRGQIPDITGDLTRQLAETILKYEYRFTENSTEEMVRFHSPAAFESAIKDGLIELIGGEPIRYQFKHDPMLLFSGWDIEVPRMGSPYLIIKGGHFNKKPIEITGIRSGATPSLKVVEFKTKCISQQVSAALGRYLDSVKDETLVFEKYDDGWRIAKDQYRIPK